LTLRQALDRLEAEGMISRRSRRGTFVQRASAVAIPRLDEMFDLMFEHSPIAVSVVDSFGYVLRSNAALQKLLGYGASELAGKLVRDFTHPDDLARQAEVVAEAIRSHRSSFQLEKRYLRSDGDVIWCRLTVYAIRTHEKDLGAISMMDRISGPSAV
jgi:PAS domain S-box-containing protein